MKVNASEKLLIMLDFAKIFKTSLEAALWVDFRLAPMDGFWVFSFLPSVSYVCKSYENLEIIE